MLTVSSRFLTAVRQTHTVAVRATLYRPSAPATPIAVNLVGGSMAADVDARTLRQGSLEIAFSLGDAVTEDVIRELPFGGYATVERGIRYASGELELVQLGRFRIENVTWPELQGQATLTLADRMAQVADESFTTPYVPTGMKASDAIVQIVQQVFPSITYHVTTTPASEPALADTAYVADRAAAVSDLASGINADAYFDNLGDFVLRPKPTGVGTPVWTLDAGASGVLVSTSESLDRSSVRNGVAVRAQADPTLPPIYSLATDADAASPTRWGGPFGKVALIVDSTSIQTQAQADATAASLLNLRLGLSRTLELHGIPNPALEPGDLISIVHADGRSELQYVNALQIGLDAEADLTLTTRANWRPQPLGLAAPRILAGETAWRELDEAELVPA
jgi:Domain of unknown function (DUF5047)